MRALAIFLSLLLAAPQGAIGFGGIVTDPTSYTYYVSQLQQMEQQVKQAVDMVHQTTRAADTLVNMKTQLEGAYNRAVGLPARLTADINSLKDVPTTLQQDAKQLQTPSSYVSSDYNLPGVQAPSTQAVTNNLDSIFGDPRDPNWSPWGAMANTRYETRQKIMKASIANSEVLLRKMPGKLKTLNDLVAQIDQTQNIKDAADLGNRFLAELILGQQQMIRILAYMAQAAAIKGFKGSTKAGAAAADVPLNGGDPTSSPATKGGQALRSQEQSLYGSGNADSAIANLGL